MTGLTKGAVLAVWAATIAAAFAVGRVSAPPESASAPVDLAAAIRAALGEKDAVNRAERTASLLQQLDSDNVLEVAAVYDRLLNILDELDIRPFAFAWARFDPAAALDHTLGWQYMDKQKNGAGAAIESWAMRDPVGARQAFKETSARLPSLSEDLFVDLLTGWVYSGAEGLDEFLASLSVVRMDTGITRVAAKLMRSGGPDAVISWGESVVQNETYENKYKKRVFRRGIRMIGRADPERSAEWAMEHVGKQYAEDAPRIVAGLLGSADGTAAMQWVRDHPSEELRGQAYREGFRTWLLTDREGATAWLESETLTEFHDPAISFYAKDLSDRAPDEAIGWCERMIDPERRLRCLESAAAKWYQRDAVAAETWLQQSPLDEEARRVARTPKKGKKRGPRTDAPPRG